MKKHNDQPISDVLHNMLRKGPLKPGFYDSKVKAAWEEKIGKFLLQKTDKIFFKKGVVHIKLNSAALRNELLIGKEQLILQFNKVIGEDIVKDIILR